jgi:hypothetical protein
MLFFSFSHFFSLFLNAFLSRSISRSTSWFSFHSSFIFSFISTFISSTFSSIFSISLPAFFSTSGDFAVFLLASSSSSSCEVTFDQLIRHPQSVVRSQ